MSLGFVEADRRSRDQQGALAVVRRPIVYCAEGHDQPEGLDPASVRILPEVPLEAAPRRAARGEHVLLRARCGERATIRDLSAVTQAGRR
jgi:DUF1680 family protein